MTQQPRGTEPRRPLWLEACAQDVRHALRCLRKSPGLIVVAVLTLALGIGVNVAIFSLVEQVLLRPLPVADPERLVNLTDPGPDVGRRSSNQSGGVDSIFSYPMFRDLERGQESFVDIAAHRIFDVSLSAGNEARRRDGVLVSGGYFSVLGLQPSLGRLLGPQDAGADGQAQSVVLSHAYWRSALGGDPDAVGRELVVNGEPLTIVGVAPPDFHGTTRGTRASVFVPITFSWSDVPGAIPNHDDRGYHWVYLFARLAPGIGRDEAEASVNSLYRSVLNDVEAPLLSGVDDEYLARFRTKSLVLEPGEQGHSPVLARMRTQLAMLFAVSGLVLLLCCANLAGLMLVRSAARVGEMAVRTSMGATRRRLASLMLSESLTLALPAAVVSLPVAWLTLRGILSRMPGPLPWAGFGVELNGAAALAAIGIAVSAALAFGLLPMRELSRAEPGRTLQTQGVRQTSGKRVTRFRRALATSQVALAMGLLAIVGVFAQSLANIARIDLGLEAESLVTFSSLPEMSGYSPERSARLFDDLERGLAEIPGVTSVASSLVQVLSNSIRGTGAAVDGAEGRIAGQTYVNFVSADFFRTLGMTLLEGREFRPTEDADAPAAAIVNERFAERFGLGRDVVGRRISAGGTEITIVGLAADAKYGAVREQIEPQVFRPYRQFQTPGAASFYVRSARPGADLIEAVRETAARVDPIVPVDGLRTMEQQVRDSVATERFMAGASTAFAVLATLLAGIGLHGVLAYSVAQRSREIGLRVALGAAPVRIHARVLGEVAAMTLGGIALGVMIAIFLGRVARGLLVDVEAGSPFVLTGAATVLAAVALVAAYVPARRAARIDPMSVLRYE